MSIRNLKILLIISKSDLSMISGGAKGGPERAMVRLEISIFMKI